MKLNKTFGIAGALTAALFALGTGSAHADTPDKYGGVSIQTDDSVIGVFGKYEIKELDGSGLLNGISARSGVFFGDDFSANVSVTADKDITDNITAFAGPVVGYDSSDEDVNLGLALGADYQIGRSDFVVNATGIVGTSDASLRLGVGYGF